MKRTFQKIPPAIKFSLDLLYIYIYSEFFKYLNKGGLMEKFKKAVRIIVAVVVISGAVIVVASNVTPTVVYGCDNGCD